MILLAAFSGSHDASAALCEDARLIAAVAEERLSRVKSDGGRFPDTAIDEVLGIAGLSRRDVDVVALGRGPFPARWYRHLGALRGAEARVREAVGRAKPKSMERELARLGHADSNAIFDKARFLKDAGFRPDCAVRFFNHHLAHALPTLFHNDWDDALLYTADGGGDNVQWSARVFRDGRLTTLWGGDEAFARGAAIDSLGLAYGFATEAVGFRMNRHEGKVTGLAALGRPVLANRLARHFRVEEDGRIASDFPTNIAMREAVFALAKGQAREDVAASVQHVLEETIVMAVRRLLERHGVRRLGLSGGVFANVRLNQRLAEETPVDAVFVYPAMSDAGLPAGGILQVLLEDRGVEAWLDRRHALDHLYLGRDFGDGAARVFDRAPGVRRIAEDPVQTVPRLLGQGKVVALFTKGGEYGPRALGARSILAAATDARLNDALNRRLQRSEFMPFAPVVAEGDTDAVFDLPAASKACARFMTVTCRVKPAWRARVPAAVHVDGTARPQVIARAPNPLYFDILAGYKKATGVPVLINTSFNVHEEPIVNAPEEALRALLDDRVDALAAPGGVWARAESR
jgi:carbamoyltransferase